MKLPSIEEAGFAFLGFSAVIGANIARRRPIYASIHTHVIGTGLGFMAGRLIKNDAERRSREKRIYIEDYIRLHPEDFPETAPKLFRDVLQKWYPVR